MLLLLFKLCLNTLTSTSTYHCQRLIDRVKEIRLHLLALVHWTFFFRCHNTLVYKILKIPSTSETPCDALSEWLMTFSIDSMLWYTIFMRCHLGALWCFRVLFRSYCLILKFLVVKKQNNFRPCRSFIDNKVNKKRISTETDHPMHPYFRQKENKFVVTISQWAL